MIVITGAAGFIGSVIIGYLNRQGIKDIIAVDSLGSGDKFRNLVGKQYRRLVMSFDEIDPSEVRAVVHCGANSNTLETDWNSIYETNVKSTREWHQLCSYKSIPFLFFSTAALYGNGQGPENLYAFSKLQSEMEIKTGVVLRLFNVYGPNEYHKGRMASVIKNWYEQLQSNNEIRVFRNSDQYHRDFIFVEDVARIVHHFLNNYQPGVYDIGTGNAVSFQTVADCVLTHHQGTQVDIDMPDDLTKQYQSFTQADTTALAHSGFDVRTMRDVETGIAEYWNYLKTNSFY